MVTVTPPPTSTPATPTTNAVVTITLVDDDGNQIELDRLDEEFTYSLDDSFAGTATRQFEIEIHRRLRGDGRVVRR